MGIGRYARRALDWVTVAEALPARPAARSAVARNARPMMLFDGSYRPVDQVVTEMMHGSGRVSQDEALSVPGVLRARNIVCGPATWPLVQLNRRNERVPNPLLEQLDPNVPNVVTVAQIIQDLLFEGIAWTRVLEVNSRNFPTKLEHLAVNRVTLQPLDSADGESPLPSNAVPRERGQRAQIMVDGEPADHQWIRRFDSPNPGVLIAAGGTIRLASTYRKTSTMYANNPRMDGYFYPKEGADPLEDDQDVTDLLDDFEAARRQHSSAYIPAALGYETVQALSPADLQLVQLHENATKDVALALGLEPEDLGISTTSRTYANVVDRRIDRINDLLQAYVLAVTQRLSMPDFTPAGNRVWADPNTYLRANPTDRIAYYKGMVELGAFDDGDVADAENVPRKAAPAPAAVGSNVVPLRQPSTAGPVPAAAPTRLEAAAGDLFEATPVTFAGTNPDARTIGGMALPYGREHIGRKNGRRYRFQQGSIIWPDPRHVPILIDHVQSASIGHYTSIEDGPDGTRVFARVSPGPMGDQALEWASPEQSVRTGFSVGVDFEHEQCIPDPLNPGGWLVPVGAAIGKEISLVAVPAFQGARVDHVTMNADTGGTTMSCARCGSTEHATAACTVTAPPNPAPADQTPPPAPAPAAPATFSAEQMGQFMAGMLAGQTPPPAAPGATFVDPVSRPVNGTPTTPPPGPVQVTEAAPYRFDAEGNLTPGPEYDFSADLVAAVQRGDAAANARALGFMKEMTAGKAYGMRRHTFDVDRADLTGVNPVRQRPDLYVDQRDYKYPLYQATRRGTLADSTAFVLPKFSSSAGLVGTHTEGVEPTSGSFVVTTQTITPTAKSGAIDMTREAWDQGGNPQASALIWRQFTRAWFEGLESGVATFLNTLTAATDITLAAGSADAVLVKAWRTAIARLQFARGGADRFDMMAAEQELYVAMATATDSAGAPLFPMIGAMNRDGTARTRYSSLDASGVTVSPSWALASTAGSPNNSWLFDSETVHTWDTGPQRLEFAGMTAAGAYAPVAYVRLAVWGYQALANTDITGVRQVIYDTVA